MLVFHDERFAALFRAEEAGERAGDSKDADDDHSVAVSLGFVCLVISRDEHRDDGRAEQKGGLGQRETVGVDGQALCRVVGQDREESDVRDDRAGIHENQEDVGHECVDELSCIREVWCEEDQEAGQAVRDGEIEKERTVVAVLRLMTVGEVADNRVRKGIDETGDEEQGTHSAGGQANDIRIEIRKEHHSHAEKDVSGGISKTVTDLFADADFTGLSLHNSSLL